MSVLIDTIRAYAESPEREAALSAVTALEALDARITQARALGAKVDDVHGAFRLLVVAAALGGPSVAAVEAASRAKEAAKAR